VIKELRKTLWFIGLSLLQVDKDNKDIDGIYDISLDHKLVYMFSVFASTEMIKFTHYLKSAVEQTAAVGQSCVYRPGKQTWSTREVNLGD